MFLRSFTADVETEQICQNLREKSIARSFLSFSWFSLTKKVAIKILLYEQKIDLDLSHMPRPQPNFDEPKGKSLNCAMLLITRQSSESRTPLKIQLHLVKLPFSEARVKVIQFL